MNAHAAAGLIWVLWPAMCIRTFVTGLVPQWLSPVADQFFDLFQEASISQLKYCDIIVAIEIVCYFGFYDCGLVCSASHAAAFAKAFMDMIFGASFARPRAKWWATLESNQAWVSPAELQSAAAPCSSSPDAGPN